MLTGMEGQRSFQILEECYRAAGWRGSDTKPGNMSAAGSRLSPQPTTSAVRHRTAQLELFLPCLGDESSSRCRHGVLRISILLRWRSNKLGFRERPSPLAFFSYCNRHKRVACDCAQLRARSSVSVRPDRRPPRPSSMLR